MANRTKIEKLEELIKDSIGGELLEQTASSLLPPGENYGSVMYKVDFKVKKDGKVQEYHAVAKCTPLNTVTQEMFNIQETFKSEIVWYTTVIPTLKQFQRDHGVEKEIDFFQPFYGARISLDPKSDKVDLDGVILTQNLKYLGYYNIDRYHGFNLSSTYIILSNLAMFHAVSLAIRTQNPELFNKNIKPYLSRIGKFDDDIQKQFNKQIYEVFDKIPECQPIMERIKRNIEQVDVFVARPAREPWCSVIHCDFWMNNIMITGETYRKTMFLDLQAPNVGSPGADLLFFLLVSVNLGVVQDYYDNLIKYYHEEFCKNLKDLGVATEIYTLDGLHQEIDIEARLGEFSHSLGHSFYILGEKGISNLDASDANYKKDDFTNITVTVNERQIKKFKWIASEAAKRKWI